MNIGSIIELVTSIIGVASILIKVFPVLNKNNKLLPIIQFIGKWIALNKTVTEKDRPE